MVIKSIAKGPWGEKEKTHTTWYEPFSEMEEIQRAVNFVLSHDVTGICTAGDITLLPLVLKACENFIRVVALKKGSKLDLDIRARSYADHLDL